jgi:hypothetical protein
MSTESGPFQPRKLNLLDLISEEPIHGLGREKFTEDQKKKLDLLLNSLGLSIDSPSLKDIRGGVALEIIRYLNESDDSSREKEIQTMIYEDLELGGDIEYKQAA